MNSKNNKAFAMSMKYILYLLPLVLPFWVAGQTVDVPDFYRSENPSSFPEVIADPPTNIYGSTIDIWIYRDGTDEIKEIAVTGHAESTTCGRVSGLFFSTYFQKRFQAQDFFVAGAGRLINDMDWGRVFELGLEDNVQAYLDKAKELDFEQTLLNAYAGDHADEDYLEQEKLVEQLQEEVEELTENETVKEYLSYMITNAFMEEFVNQSTGIAQSSGLVRIHDIPYKLIEDVNNRIAKKYSMEDGSIIRFDDLLEEYGLETAAVWVPITVLGSGQALKMTLPIAELSQEQFQAAKTENRSTLLTATIGDADRRINFFQEQKKKIKQQQEQLRTWPSSELQQKTALGSAILSQGVEVQLSSSEQEMITYQEYLDKRIPDLLTYLDEEIEALEEVKRDLFSDDEETNARIERINHMTLIDAMLRDWSLPVGKSQYAFEMWQESIRPLTWARIAERLKDQSIQPNTIANSSTIFSIDFADEDLDIKPFQILDLSNSVLVVDQAANILRMEDTWTHRSLVPDPALEALNTADLEHFWNQIAQLPGKIDEQEAEVIQDAGLFLQSTAAVLDPKTDWSSDYLNHPDLRWTTSKVIAAFEKQEKAELQAQLLQLLQRFPERTITSIENYFLTQSEQNRLLEDSTMKSSQTLIKSRETIKSINELGQEEEASSLEEYLSYLNWFQQFLETDPNLPPDVHFRFLKELALIINPVNNGGSWRVIRQIESGSKRFDLYRGLKRTDALSFDTVEEVKKQLEIIRTKDKAYYNHLVETQGNPERPSKRLNELLQFTEADLSLFQEEAIVLLSNLTRLQNRSQGQEASYQLWAEDTPDKTLLLELLDEALKADIIKKNPFFLTAQQQISNLEKYRVRMDYIEKSRLSSLLDNGCENNLKEVEYSYPLQQQSNQVSFPSHRAVNARLWYEVGNYIQSFNVVYSEHTNLMHYSPALQWEKLDSSVIGTVERVVAIEEDGALICLAESEEESHRVLKISGLHKTELMILIEEINSLDRSQWYTYEKLSEKLLRVEVPQREEVQLVLDIIESETIIIPMLKVMIYLKMPPAQDLIPLRGFDKLAQSDRKKNDQMILSNGMSLEVPSLEELCTKLSND